MKKYSILFLGLGLLLGIGCSKDAENDLNNKNLSPQQVQAQMAVNNSTDGLDETLADLWLNNSSGNATAKNGLDCMAINYTEKNISVAYNKCTINGHILDGSLILAAGNVNEGNNTGDFVISFNAFSFNGYLLEGTKRFAYDYSELNRPVFTIVTDLTIKNPEGEIIKHNGDRILTWNFDQSNEGADFSWVGEWDMVHNGTTYSFHITDPLSGTIDCAYITSGVLALEVGNLTASLDFGQGTCDQKGVVSYPNGDSEEISW